MLDNYFEEDWTPPTEKMRQKIKHLKSCEKARLKRKKKNK